MFDTLALCVNKMKNMNNHYYIIPREWKRVYDHM